MNSGVEASTALMSGVCPSESSANLSSRSRVQMALYLQALEALTESKMPMVL